ncbi:hypothetical protein MMC29_001220 [Sticta canariensis]|nr:hypothetical protein [Sticta canariensis]
MSGTGEERWRTPRGHQNPPPQHQNRHNSQQQRQSSLREGGGSQGKQSASGQGDWASHGPPQEQHVSVRAFNALEVRDTLKNGYSAVGPEHMRSLKYKASGAQPKNAKSSGGPWASKPHTMANGKDFFLELRKQISALQQGGERAGG